VTGLNWGSGESPYCYKNPFPLEGSLKIRVDRKNLPSHKAMESAMKAKMPIMYQREVGHTNWYEAHYQKRCLKNAATGLHFAKEVVSERQPSSLSYMEFDSRGLYDPCSVIQKQKSEDFTPRPRRLKPLKKQIYQLKSEGALAKPPTPPNFPYFVEELPVPPNLKWEERLLTKLSKATAQWIVNNQPAWGRWVQGKPRGFRRQKYDWSSIKYVLTSESDMELLNEIEAEALVGSHIEIHEKKPETSLLAYYRVLAIDDPSANNKTADRVSKKSFKPLSPVKRRGRLNSVVGKYSYTTQNIFEQDLYFGRWNRNIYKSFFQRIQKGAIHWTSLPTSIEDFAQSGGEQQSSVSTGRKREGYRKSEDVSEIIQIRRTMLEQWKADWKLDPPWQSATIEGLSRGLVDVHVQNRINAILICASAVLERPQRLQQSSQESLETEALPAKIQPLLKNNLFDEDAHVRMAAAVCFYAMGEWYQEAQDIMRNALLNG
uniref:Uncharacterized protein n=1 Tax=Anolis carolinensis TaxID=28377 RepID=G1KS52_ANOCA